MNDVPRGLSSLLSLFVPGVGQLLDGRPGLGAFLWLAPAVLGMLVFVGAKVGGFFLAATVIVVLIIFLGLHLYAALEPWWNRNRKPARLGPLALTALLLVGALYPLGMAMALRQEVTGLMRFVGSSMGATIQDGDHLLVSRYPAISGELRKGDLVVFEAPDREGQLYLKRILGLPGDRFKKTDQGWRMVLRDDDSEVLNEAVFVVGDAPENSRDSRHFGPIPLNKIVGRVEARLWPWTRGPSLN